MRAFTDQELGSLITCSKQVVEAPRRDMRQDSKMKRNEMTLKSSTGKDEFRVFMRQSDDFPENFSIGLVYLPGEEPGEFILLRCNGQHGGTKVHPHHANFHTHRMKAEDLAAGIKEPRIIEEAKGYASFAEALRAFCQWIGLSNADTDIYFPSLNQGRLFPEDGAKL
jgi:hypothetical protein